MGKVLSANINPEISMLENPYGLAAGGRPQRLPVGTRPSSRPSEAIGRVLSPGRRSRLPSLIESATLGQLGVTGLPGGYSGPLTASGVRDAMALGPIRG